MHHVVDWYPEAEELALVKYLLRLESDRESLIEGLFSLSQLILSGKRDQMTPWGLAVVLPVAKLEDVVDLGMLKRWNWCWGCLLGRSRELMEPEEPLNFRMSGWSLVLRLYNEATEAFGQY